MIVDRHDSDLEVEIQRWSTKQGDVDKSIKSKKYLPLGVTAITLIIDPSPNAIMTGWQDGQMLDCYQGLKAPSCQTTNNIPSLFRVDHDDPELCRGA